MMKKSAHSLYKIDRYIRCGEMPLFLLFCRDRHGLENYCVMLCSLKRLRELVRIRRGFSEPSRFGRVLCVGHGAMPRDTVCEMLKARYGFDLENHVGMETRLF